MERHEAEREVLSYLAKIPSGRKIYKDAGINKSWFRDPLHQIVWDIIEESEGSLTDGVIQELGANEWASCEFTRSVEELIAVFQDVVLRNETELAFARTVKDQTTKAIQFYRVIQERLAALEVYAKPLQGQQRFFEDIDEVIHDYIARKELKGMTGFPWPFPTLNDLTNGINKTDFVVYYGHAKAMKTWLWMVTLHHLWWEAKVPIVIYSGEMDETILRRRLGAWHARVDYSRFVKGCMTEEEEDRLQDAIDAIAEREESVPVFWVPVRQTGEQGIREFMDKAVEYEAAAAFFDALNTLAVEWEEVTKMTRMCKRLVKEVGIPLIGTTQARRIKRIPKNPKEVNPEDDVGGSLSWSQDPDALIRTIKKGPHQLIISLKSMRETPEDMFTVRAIPAIQFEELQKSKLNVNQQPNIIDTTE